MKYSLARVVVFLGIIQAFCLTATPVFAENPEDSFEFSTNTDISADDDDDDDDANGDIDMSGADAAGAPAIADPGKFPDQELSAETLQEFLIAEIAASRGQFRESTQAYIALARKTRDPRIAHRAAYIATHAKEPQLIAEAARLWTEIAPNSKEARQFADYIERGHSPALDRVREVLARTLAQNPEKLAPNLMSLNRALSKVEDKNVARNLIQRATEPYLMHPEAHFARAQAALVAKRPMEAAGALDRALELRPDWLPALMLKTHILVEVGAADQANQMLEAVLAREPNNRELRIAYARSLIAASRFAAARDEFNALLAATPGDRDLLYTVAMLSAEIGDNASAELLLKKALASGHPQADLIRLQLGKIAAERGEHAAARQWFDAVSPGGYAVEARIHSARSLSKEGRLGQARKLLRDAPNPEIQRRYLQAESQLLVEAGRARQAFDLIENALREHPDDKDLLYDSAMLAERIGLHETMESRLRKLIALVPDHAHACNALGYSLADRGERLDEAEKLIARALEILPRDPYILDSMGWVRFKRGDLAGALERLEQAHTLRADPEIAAHLGEVLLRLGRGDEARRVLDKAKTANPGNATLKETILRLYPASEQVLEKKATRKKR
ncbi:MAG: tetratricopeptide repeat protein [Azoarcus sp.]|jgi:tetratricopeptide (TPR) repeat protein|nr:tetratricopeptide repeat protein [Azoarcus sp.]